MAVVDTISVVSWNIKQFSQSKWNGPTRQNIILSVLQNADVVFITEAPADVNASVALGKSMVDALNTGGVTTWRGRVDDAGGTGGEKETVIALWNTVRVGVSGQGQMKPPENDLKNWDNSVRFALKYEVEWFLSTDASKQYNVAVWHAPPTAKAYLMPQVWGKLYSQDTWPQIFVGDFNQDINIKDTRYSYKAPSGGTMFVNAGQTQVTSWDDFIIKSKSSANDRVLATNPNLVNAAGLYTGPLRANNFKFTDIYSVSDHCPLLVKLQ